MACKFVRKQKQPSGMMGWCSAGAWRLHRAPLERLSHPIRPHALALALCGVLSATITHAQIWVNPATGDWFTASNWNPAAVPIAGDQVIISNGGTATLAGPPSTPSLLSLGIGVGGSGTGRGTVSSTGVSIATGSVSAGENSSGSGTAEGKLLINGAQLIGNNSGDINAGVISGNGTALAQAIGTIDVGGISGSYGNYVVGTVTGTQLSGSNAQGSVTVGALSPTSSTGNVFAGFISGTNGSGGVTADGSLSLANSLTISNGNLIAGQSFGSGTGSQATGTVSIGGDVGGAVSFLLSGSTFSNTPAQTGSRSHGSISIGGNLALQSTAFVNAGVTFGNDRVADAGAPGGFRVDQATGSINIGGTLSIVGLNAFQPSLFVGTTNGGVVDGTLRAGAIDMGGNRFATVVVGAAGASGQANGMVEITSGNINVSAVSVAGNSLGTAAGSLVLGGQLVGDNSSALNVGTLGTNGSQAIGGIVAAGGISGFNSYNVGTALGTMASGAVARGSVTGGAGAPTSSTNNVFVGFISGTNGSGGVAADGSLSLANSLAISNGNLIAGYSLGSGTGSQATGTVSIGGDVGGAVSFLLSGLTTSNTPAQTGSRSNGSISIGGNLALQSTAFVDAGVTFGNDRVADAGAPGGFRVDQATGSINIGGTLSIVGSNAFQPLLFVGTTNGGVVNGTLRAGAIDTGANRFATVVVGAAGADGQANGNLEINGGALRVEQLNVGNAPGASGRIALSNANLDAINVFAGSGGGTAQIVLSNSQAAVAQNFSLEKGAVSLERSQLTVGNTFVLGNDALTHIEIDGLTRGTEYGAINALTAFLDGDIEFDFGDFSLGGASAVFDIVRSGSASGIVGDFDSFTFLHLAPEYSATAGIELDGGLEFYRVRLTRNGVPEPATLLLILLGLTALSRSRRHLRT